MSQLLTIRFNRHDAQPWGFRLQGGVDFGTPLVVQKVAGGSIADRAGLNAGDAIIKVNSTDVYNLRHKDAQDVIVRAGNTFDFTVQRGGGTWRPHVTPTGALPNPAPQYNYPNVNTVTKTSLAHKQPESRPIGTGYNNSARPFAPQNGGPVKSIVNKQYNTPVGMYSDESIAETLSAQAEVLANGVLGVNFKKNEKIYNAANSEVLKALHEAENDPVEPEGIHSPVTKHVSAPVDRPQQPNVGGLPVGQNICAECERLIVGVFVRIKDKNLHAECFRCATCGTSLKNQGYFNVNNKLYCDLHAKLAAMSNPPTGTDGYLPVPVKPGTKMSANTISAALTAHHPGSNGNLPSPSLNQPMNNNTPSYGPPKPYGYQAEPPSAGPRSPATYNAPSWIQPKPSGVNNFSPNYNTMPRSNVPQPTAVDEINDVEEELTMQRQQQQRNISWPPPQEISIPTASSLYVQPPETQHIKLQTYNSEGPPVPPPVSRESPENLNQGNDDYVYPMNNNISYSALEEFTEIKSSNEQNTLSGRRSVQECKNTIESTVDTYQLVSYLKEIAPPPPETPTMFSSKKIELKSCNEEVNYERKNFISESERSEHYVDNCSTMSKKSSVDFTPTMVSSSHTVARDEHEREVFHTMAELPPTQIPNPMPKEWMGPITKAMILAPETPINTATGSYQSTARNDKSSYAYESYSTKGSGNDTDLDNNEPNRSFMSSVLTIAPSKTVELMTEFEPVIPLPEESEPYVSHPIDMTPKQLDEFNGFKSPMLKALMTAPDRPFTPFDKDVISQYDDFPEPSDTKLSFVDALTVAPDTCYTPFDPNLAATLIPPEEPKEDPEVIAAETIRILSEKIDSQIEEQISAFVDVSGFRSVNPFKPNSSCLPSVTNHLIIPQKRDSVTNSNECSHETCMKSNELNECSHPTEGTANESTPIDTPETTELRPKKSKNKKSFVSGLHKPERIPKYQRNWTVLKSQTPIKSPIPPELEENIPLAFVEVPKHNTGEDLPNPPAPPERIHEYTQQSNTSYAANNQISSSTIIRNYIEDENESMKSVSTRHSMQQTKIIPKLIEPDAPSMSRSPPGSHYEEPIRRVTTPSLIKHAPTLPYYQQNLIFEAYGPTKAREFIRSRTPSPCLDRARSPAPGPPPNLLSVAAPHMQDLLSDTESVNYNQSSQYSVQAFNSNEISEEKSFVAYHSSNLKSYESTVQEQQYSNSMNDSLSNSSNIQHNLRNQENISRPSEGFKDCKRESIPYPHTTTMESPQFYNSIKNENPSYSSPTMTPATNYPTQFQPSRRESEMSIRSEPKPRKPSVTYEKRRPSATGFVQRQARRLSELDQQITDKSPDFPQINTPTPSSRFPVKSLFSTSEINSDVQAPFSYIISDKNKLKSPPKTQQSFMEQSFGSQKDSHDYEMKSTSTFKSTPQTAVDPIPLPVSHYNTVPVISTPVNDINTLTSFPPPPFTLTSNAAATASTSFSATSSHLVATKQEMTSTSISSLNNNEMPTQVISAFKAMHTNESYGFNKEPQLNSNPVSGPSNGSIGPNKGGTFVAKSAPRRGQGVLNKAIPPGGRVPLCGCCSSQISSEVDLTTPPNQLPITDDLNTMNSLEETMKSLEVLDKDDDKDKARATILYSLKKPPLQTVRMEPDSKQEPLFINCQGSGLELTTDLDESNRQSLSQSVGNGRVHNKGFGNNRNSYPMYLESNNNNSNAMPKLISHARDRRSYMETNNLPVHSGYYDDATEATYIASELAGGKIPMCCKCHIKIVRGPFITALGRIWCPDHFICVNSSCRRPLQDIGFVEEKGDLYCEYCFEKYLAPCCSKCMGKIKGDCLNAIGKHYHPECFNCCYCGKLFGNSPFFLEEGQPYCEADWNELFTTKCFACGFPVEAGDRWVEALSHNYHSQCFNCSMCKKNLEGQSFFAKNGRPFCKAHAR